MTISKISPPSLPGSSSISAVTGPSAAERALGAAKLAAGHDANEAAKGFEAVFLTQFVDSMFSGLGKNGLFGGGSGEKMWRGFLAQHIADSFAERGGLGIADQVKAQILKMQGDDN